MDADCMLASPSGAHFKTPKAIPGTGLGPSHVEAHHSPKERRGMDADRTPGVAIGLGLTRASPRASDMTASRALLAAAAASSTFMLALAALVFLAASSRLLCESFTVKNCGPCSASHSGSTAVTHCTQDRKCPFSDCRQPPSIFLTKPS